MPVSFKIRKLHPKDKSWLIRFITKHWGAPIVISRRKQYPVENLPGFAAFQNDEYVGLITLCIENSECQIVTLNAEIENIGIGTGLINYAIEYAVQKKCKRIWLITTNDNTPALRFYQKRGFKIKAIYCNEIEFACKLKPEIPLYGIDNIPIWDEIELEYAFEERTKERCCRDD